MATRISRMPYHCNTFNRRTSLIRRVFLSVFRYTRRRVETAAIDRAGSAAYSTRLLHVVSSAPCALIRSHHRDLRRVTRHKSVDLIARQSACSSGISPQIRSRPIRLKGSCASPTPFASMTSPTNLIVSKLSVLFAGPPLQLLSFVEGIVLSIRNRRWREDHPDD